MAKNKKFIVLIAIPAELFINYKIFNDATEAKKFFIDICKKYGEAYNIDVSFDLDEQISEEDNYWKFNNINILLEIKELRG